MAFVIFGKQNYLIKKQTKKIISNFSNVDNNNVIYFDSKKLDESELLNECEQISLSCDTKIIVVENSNFLTTERDKDKFAYSDKLVNYLNNENELTQLIFTYEGDKELDSKNPVVKLIKDKKQIFEAKDLTKEDWNTFATNYFNKRDVTISKDALDAIIDASKNDVNNFINEVSKLLLYKQNNINIDDVEQIIVKSVEDNVYGILNFLFENKKEEALKLYKDLLLLKVEPVSLMQIMISNLIFIDRLLFVKNINSNEFFISKELGANYGRVKAQLSSIKNIKQEFIKQKIEELYSLDHDIKHNLVDRFYAFELFIIKF